jgi:hypothetical protein
MRFGSEVSLGDERFKTETLRLGFGVVLKELNTEGRELTAQL